MPWNKQDILPRVEARAQELGKSLTEILPPSYRSFFAPSKAEASPTIDTLETIARALGWTLCDLLCEPIALDLAVVELAVGAACRAIGLTRLDLLVPGVVSAYDVLSAIRREGREPEPRDISVLEATLRAQSRGR